MVTALQTDKRQSTEETLAALTARQENERNKAREITHAEEISMAYLTDDDLRQECKESLVMMLRRSKGDLKALGAVRELLDRLEGRPVQRILEKTQRVDNASLLDESERIKQADDTAEKMLEILSTRVTK